MKSREFLFSATIEVAPVFDGVLDNQIVFDGQGAVRDLRAGGGTLDCNPIAVGVGVNNGVDRHGFSA